MGEGSGAFRIVQGGGDEDESGQYESERSEPESEGCGHAERVVDARADVAVARGKERGRAQRPRQLRRPPYHDAKIAWEATAPCDGLGIHRLGGELIAVADLDGNDQLAELARVV